MSQAPKKKRTPRARKPKPVKALIADRAPAAAVGEACEAVVPVAPVGLALIDQVTVVDVETTGVNTRYARIIEIGLVDGDGNAWDTLVRPSGVIAEDMAQQLREWLAANPGKGLRDRITQVGDGPYDPVARAAETWYNLVSPKITEITGITPEQILDAPTTDQILPYLQWRLQNKILVAHNARYDIEVIRQEMRRCGIEWEPAHVVCTLVLARRAFRTTNHKLETLVEELHIKATGRAHGALADSHSALEVFKLATARLGLHAKEDVVIKGQIGAKDIPVGDVMPYGKHKGVRWEQVPQSYLAWLVEQQFPEPALKARAQAELEVRKEYKLQPW